MKVRELIRLIEADGWVLVRTRGSHRQYKHVSKVGLVTVPGHLSDDLAPGTANSILPAGRVEVMKRYLIVVERTETGYSAFSPDVPGCISTGRTRQEIEANMRDAIEFHIEGLQLEGLPVPEPGSEPAYVDVAA